MAQKFIRKDWKAVCRGMKLAAPGDLLPEGKFYFLQNVRTILDGVIQSRPGLEKVVDLEQISSDPIRALHTLNNPLDSTYSYICGSGTGLYSTFKVSGATNATPIVITADRAHNLTTGDPVMIYGVSGNPAANGSWNVTVLSTTTFSLDTSVGSGAYTSGGIVATKRDTGYSGNPLTLIPHQPAQSPEPWVYVADSTRMRKINSKGVDYPWGTTPFNTAPTATLASASYKTVSDFENTTESAVAWTNGGTAGAPATSARLSALAVTAVVYDSGTSGWANVVPSSFPDDIQPGMFVTTAVTTAETAKVDSVYDPIVNTTISSVSYDSGSTGLCTVQLTVPTAGLVKDCVVYNSTRTQRVRVISVTPGPTGIASFRCDTGATTWAATDTVQGQRSFRVYFVNTHNATTTLSSNFFRFSNATGVGYINHVLARDLSNTGAAGRPITGDDIVHISIRVDSLVGLSEGRILFDIDGSVNDFTRNYLFHEFRANDLAPALTGTQTVLPIQQRIVQRQEIESRQTGRMIERGFVEPYFTEDPVYAPIESYPLDPQIPTGQTGTGDNQWFELKVKVSDLKRIGSDSSRTLANVAAIRVQINSSVTLQVDVDAWWVGGTYGLNLLPDREPYLYRARPRSTVTGTKGNPSPPMRSGVRPERQSVSLTIAQHTDSQIDVIDWFRTGGDLLDWYYVGTSANSATPTFTDEYSDEIIKFNPILEFDNYQPFPVVDTPRSGVCNVRGSTIDRVSGDTFNTSWAAGSLIEIDGVACSLYASPSSTAKLEISESLGTRTNVSFRLPSPTKLAQPMAAVWGPYGLGDAGSFVFACKEGTLYWTKAGDPDSAPDTSSLRVTSGSEILVNGCIYDGRPYLFSDRRMYQVTPLPVESGGVTFQVTEVAHSEGLWSTWGLTVLDRIYFIGRNGIYASDGGRPVSITDEDLYPLFPHDGIPGESTNGVPAPDFSNEASLRLSGAGSYLYLDYKNGSSYYTLTFDFRIGGWCLDQYQPSGVTLHQRGYAEGSHSTLLGGSNGILYQFSDTIEQDDGVDPAIPCEVWLRAEDYGEAGANKVFGDYGLDVDLLGGTLTSKVYSDSFQTLYDTDTLVGTSGRNLTIFNLNSGEGLSSRFLALALSWDNLTGQTPLIYGGYVTATPEPENTETRATDWTDAGYPGPKWVQGVRITADTFGVAKTVRVEYDGGTLGATLTVNHDGRLRVGYPNTASPTWEPFIGTLLRLRPTDSNPWILRDEEVEWIYEPEPELATYWKTQPTTHDLEDFHFIREMLLCVRSTSTVTLTVSVDGIDYIYTLASTAGDQRVVRIIPQAVKGKIFQYTLSSSTGFRVYKEDCSVLVKRQSDGDYQRKMPFGDISRLSGARI